MVVVVTDYLTHARRGGDMEGGRMTRLREPNPSELSDEQAR